MASTEYGSNLLLKLTSTAMNLPFSYQQAKGSLIKNLTLYNFSYNDANLSLNADVIHLNWQPRALFNKKIVINNLLIKNMHIALHSQESAERSPHKTHFSNPFSNWKLTANNILLSNISLSRQNTQKLIIKNLQGNILVDTYLAINLSIKTSMPQNMEAHVRLRGTSDNDTWNLNLLNSKSTQLLISGKGDALGTGFTTNNTDLFQGHFFAQGRINWQPQLFWDIQLSAKKLNFPAANLKLLSFQGKSIGNLNAVDFKLSQLQGSYNDLPLNGHIIAGFSLPPMTAAPANISPLAYALEHLKLYLDTQLRLGMASAVIAGKLDPNWDMHLNLHVPDMVKIIPSIKGSLALTGTIQGDALIPILNANLELPKLRSSLFPDAALQTRLTITSRLLPENQHCNLIMLTQSPHSQCSFQLKISMAPSLLTFKNKLQFPFSGELSTDFTAQGLLTQLHFLINKQDFIRAEIQLPNYTLGKKFVDNQVISGQIKVNLNQNQLGDYKIPLLNNFQANLKADIHLSGNLRQPILNGNAFLNSSQLTLPDYNLHLLETQVNLQASDNKFSYFGSSSSGGGKIRLTGQSLLENKTLITRVSISGNKFLVSNTPQIKVFISPDLNLDNRNDEWHITGSVFIPTAFIDLPKMDTVITMPSETMYIDQNQKPSKSESLPIYTQVSVRLGDDIHADVNGFAGQLAGQVDIEESPGRPTIGHGRIYIKKGEYDIRGDKLTVDYGYINFSNSLLTNPFLDIQASKNIKFQERHTSTLASSNLKVGVSVTGTATNPVMKLFSNPARWSQADILSFIIFGQPSSLASGPNLQLLMRAAQALNSSKHSNIGSLQQTLQKGLGLTEFQFVSGINKTGGGLEQSNSLVLGKALSPRITLSYSLGILNSINILRIKYLLKKNWFIQTNASQLGTGADLIYSIKR